MRSALFRQSSTRSSSELRGQVLARRNRQLSDDEMLALLKDLYAKHGRLSSIIIDQSRDLPVSLTYRQRFGSLGRVYRLVGYVQQRADRSIEINRTLRRLHSDVYREVITKIEQLGGTVARDGPKGLITINGEFTGSIVIARCLSTRSGGAMRWNLAARYGSAARYHDRRAPGAGQ